MAKKVLILAGAPESQSLDWTTPDLLRDFQSPLLHFGDPSKGCIHIATQASSNPAPDHAVWRVVPLKREHIRTGFSQQHDPGLIANLPLGAGTDFFTSVTASLPASADESQEGSQTAKDVLSQFYEHSLAFHDDIPSSQLPGGTSVSTSQDTTSFQPSSSDDLPPESYPRAPVRTPLAPHGNSHLSDLEDIPTPAHLQSLSPQTVTVNLIVGIISIAQPRTVKTRWGASKSLVEVLVGDDTKSGFAVTFWLSDSERNVLAGLRVQDVVLLRNVALHVFMKKVYGSSLRNQLTKVHLLYRRRLDAGDEGGHYGAEDLVSGGHPQVEKTRRVRDWVIKFVGLGTEESGKGKGARRRAWDVPPPHDTQ